ncbi:hypothetical protein EC844_11492 [Acinetobacter calcoaceticus]|uniref:Uncharacterized protein n=1 Tax=Acinetobacter calcoaceticus TaxID=471 RepID=A0A4R1XQ35_ACICA|nr:hypothetical protein EC844_11492 [Acinetobacter calcoaceticus]
MLQRPYAQSHLVPAVSAESAVHQRQFQQWISAQPSHQIEEYQRYVRKYVKVIPSIFVLTYYPGALKRHCESQRFMIPAQTEWLNIVTSLQLYEKLQATGLLKYYQIISVRGIVASCQEKNRNVVSFVASGVYAKALPRASVGTGHDAQEIDALCGFWQQEGRHFKMGLGIYEHRILHINRQNHRSWSQDATIKEGFCPSMQKFGLAKSHRILQTEMPRKMINKSYAYVYK